MKEFFAGLGGLLLMLLGMAYGLCAAAGGWIALWQHDIWGVIGSVMIPFYGAYYTLKTLF